MHIKGVALAPQGISAGADEQNHYTTRFSSLGHNGQSFGVIFYTKTLDICEAMAKH